MRTIFKVLLAILLVLIAVRIYLPYWITDYVNRELDDLPEYTGSIEGVNLNLYRGAYQVEGLEIDKIEEGIPAPFVKADLIDLSVQWGALFSGSLVGEIEIYRPVVNFGANQTGTEVDWTGQVKELMPIQINRFSVNDGEVAYRDFESDPEVVISLDNLQIEATNFSNVEAKEDSLPSIINVSAVSIGDGKLNAYARANVLKEIPDFDLDFSLEDVSLPALNDLSEAYANLDFEEGSFDLYVEMAVADGILEGYLRPIMTNVKIFDIEEDTDNVLSAIWEGAAEVVTSIFQNQPKDRFATQAPLEGDLNDPETSVWTTIANILRNTFVEAFQKQTDDSVDFEDVKQ